MTKAERAFWGKGLYGRLNSHPDSPMSRPDTERGLYPPYDPILGSESQTHLRAGNRQSLHMELSLPKLYHGLKTSNRDDRRRDTNEPYSYGSTTPRPMAKSRRMLIGSDSVSINSRARTYAQEREREGEGRERRRGRNEGIRLPISAAASHCTVCTYLMYLMYA